MSSRGSQLILSCNERFPHQAGIRVEIWCDPNEKMYIELFERVESTEFYDMIFTIYYLMKVFSPVIDIQQELANYALLPMFINKVLLDYSHTCSLHIVHGCFSLRQSGVVCFHRNDTVQICYLSYSKSVPSSDICYSGVPWVTQFS